jgi:hypothetical protein
MDYLKASKLLAHLLNKRRKVARGERRARERDSEQLPGAIQGLRPLALCRQFRTQDFYIVGELANPRCSVGAAATLKRASAPLTPDEHDQVFDL